MTPETLQSLLRAPRPDSVGPGPDCPDEHTIAAYVDGTVSTESRDGLEAHLADCDHCLALVGFLSRERSEETAIRTAARSIGQIREPAGLSSRPTGPVTPRWAVAAVLMLAVVGVLRLTMNSGPNVERAGDAKSLATRSGSPAAVDLRLLSPSAGATLSSRHLAFRWTPVSGARYYDVRVVTDAGDVVTEAQVAGTEWRPPNQAALHPGAEYFVHVDAIVSGDKTVSSEHVAFRVSD